MKIEVYGKQLQTDDIKDINIFTNYWNQVGCKDPNLSNFKKIKKQTILNVPIIIVNWTIKDSIYKKSDSSNKCITIYCINLDNGQNIYFNTGSSVLYQQLQRIKKQQENNKIQYFKCILKSQNNYYRFDTTIK